MGRAQVKVSFPGLTALKVADGSFEVDIVKPAPVAPEAPEVPAPGGTR